MGSTLTTRIQSAVEGLTPGYFALVMGTGIISVGMELRKAQGLSDALLGICLVSFVVLFVLTAWRVVSYRRATRDDFLDPSRAFGFLTFVAGTNVVAVRLGMAAHYGVQVVLLVVAGTAWVVLGYVVPWTAVLGRNERPVVASANGTWFIWVVASQSVAVCAAGLEPAVETGRDELALVAVVSWSVGICLYAAAGMLVALRLMLYSFGPEDLTPPYWVSMGALSITVLAGARIVEMANAPIVLATRGLVVGVDVVFWAFATWLIPVLVAAGVWRHFVCRIPLRYDATLWSIIFPLGMYGVASMYLGQADHLPLVEGMGRGEIWLAFTAWLVVFVAMAAHVTSTVLMRPPAGDVVRSRAPR